jgi:DnaJ like chaperone protein
LLGAFARGHVFDHDNDGRPEHQAAFTIGVIALGAKMAKADGVVTSDEMIAFKEMFKVPEGEMENVSRIFQPRQAGRRRLRSLCQAACISVEG